jgi:hypothetical protein
MVLEPNYSSLTNNITDKLKTVGAPNNITNKLKDKQWVVLRPQY